VVSVSVAVYENAEPETNVEGVKTIDPERYFTSVSVPGGGRGAGGCVVVGDGRGVAVGGAECDTSRGIATGAMVVGRHAVVVVAGARRVVVTVDGAARDRE